MHMRTGSGAGLPLLLETSPPSSLVSGAGRAGVGGKGAFAVSEPREGPVGSERRTLLASPALFF